MWGYHPLVAGLTFLGCKLEALRECNAFDDHTSIELASRTTFLARLRLERKVEATRSEFKWILHLRTIHTRTSSRVRYSWDLRTLLWLKPTDGNEKCSKHLLQPSTHTTCHQDDRYRPRVLRSIWGTFRLVWRANSNRTRKEDYNMAMLVKDILRKNIDDFLSTVFKERKLKCFMIHHVK